MRGGFRVFSFFLPSLSVLDFSSKKPKAASQKVFTLGHSICDRTVHITLLLNNPFLLCISFLQPSSVTYSDVNEPGLESEPGGGEGGALSE